MISRPPVKITNHAGGVLAKASIATSRNPLQRWPGASTRLRLQSKSLGTTSKGAGSSTSSGSSSTAMPAWRIAGSIRSSVRCLAHQVRIASQHTGNRLLGDHIRAYGTSASSICTDRGQQVMAGLCCPVMIWCKLQYIVRGAPMPRMSSVTVDSAVPARRPHSPAATRAPSSSPASKPSFVGYTHGSPLKCPREQAVQKLLLIHVARHG